MKSQFLPGHSNLEFLSVETGHFQQKSRESIFYITNFRNKGSRSQNGHHLTRCRKNTSKLPIRWKVISCVCCSPLELLQLLCFIFYFFNFKNFTLWALKIVVRGGSCWDIPKLNKSMLSLENSEINCKSQLSWFYEGCMAPCSIFNPKCCNL